MQEEQQLAAHAAQQRREAELEAQHCAELRAVRQEAGRQAEAQEAQLASCSSALAQEQRGKEEAMAACAEAHQQLLAMQVRAAGVAESYVHTCRCAQALSPGSRPCQRQGVEDCMCCCRG